MSRHITTALLVLLLSGCTVGSQRGRDKSAEGGRLGEAQVETPIRDLGTLKYGDIAGTKFKIKNIGDRPITISKIDKGCACTEVKYDKGPIDGNSERVIEVIFDSSGLSGYQYKTITAMLEGCETKRIKLAITANIEY